MEGKRERGVERGALKRNLTHPREHSRQAFVTDFLTNRSLDTTALEPWRDIKDTGNRKRN